MDSRCERASTPKETIFCPHCEQYLRKKTYRRHKFLYFDDVAEKWTRTQSQAHGEGDDEAFDEVDFLADEEPTEMNMTRITEKKKEEPPIVDFDFDFEPNDMDVDLTTDEHHGESCILYSQLACRNVMS